jgi:hypothetical protein
MKNLILSLDKKEKRALSDNDAVLRERTAHPRPPITVKGYPFWDTSLASTFLKEDMKHDLHKSMSLDEFWGWREEYQQFPRDVFRKHIQQEGSNNLQKTYWLKKKAKKN